MFKYPKHAIASLWAVTACCSFTGGCDFTVVRDAVTSLFRVSVVRGCDRPDCGWHVRLTVDRTVLLLAADSESGDITVTAVSEAPAAVSGPSGYTAPNGGLANPRPALW